MVNAADKDTKEYIKEHKSYHFWRRASISIGPSEPFNECFWQPYGVAVIDAHADLRSRTDGTKFNSASCSSRGKFRTDQSNSSRVRSMDAIEKTFMDEKRKKHSSHMIW